MPYLSLDRSATWKCLGIGCALTFVIAGHAAGQDVPAPALTPVWAPDVFGGYSSTYIIVQAKPGMTPVRLADGGWTFAPVSGKPPAIGAAAAQRTALAAATKRRGVRNIVPALTHQPANKALAAQHGLDRYYKVQVPKGSDTPAIAAELAAAGFNLLIERAMVDGIGGIAAIPNDAQFSSQWNMHNTGQSGGVADADVDAPECWDLRQGSIDTIVAVLDTGVQQAYTQKPPNPDPSTVEHPDLTGKVISGWDFFEGNANTSDYHGHGTHCAGTVAAIGNNGIGIAGLNWNAKILAVKVVANSGSGLPNGAIALADGVIFATDQGAHVLSMSLQYLDLAPDHPLAAAVAYAYDSNVLPIAATGNQGSLTNIAYPAKFPKCMAVGATNSSDVRWSASNAGPEIDVMAPGAGVFSLWKLGGFSTQSGTSMAVPHVSGLASLIRSYNPSLTVAQIEEIIKSTADDKGAAGWDSLYGWGRVNANAALIAATPPGPGCLADLTGNDTVDVDDLLTVINAWGFCPQPPAACQGDIHPPESGGNGSVNVDDLLMVINGWGLCP